MAHDGWSSSELVRSFRAVLQDFSDLVQKEIRLAKAEVTDKVASKIQAGIWMAVALLLGVLAVILLVATAVLAIVALGVAPHWACLIVAALLGVAAAAFFFYGRALAKEELTPTRAMRQVALDIKTAKEQLT
jgi:VIT1/CCC1 family predicted Fe2+/Mn2+ transporter